MSSESNLDPRRTSRDQQSSNASPLRNLPASAPGLPPLRSSSTHQSPVAASATGSPFFNRLWGPRLTRQRGVDERPDTDTDPDTSDTQREPFRDHRRPIMSQRRSRHSLDDITSTERELENVDSELRDLWHLTNASSIPYSDLAFPFTSMQTQSASEEGRRAKRRKLDSDRLTSGFTGFRYGKYGQVEPGQLTMEIVSCDGGIYDDGQKHAAENILKNDSSVYCTSGPTCNIILRHQGATAFTLKELVIKAPRTNYTSPVSEGMVFVSMSSDHLLTRTAQYQIQYSSPRSSSRRDESENQLFPVISIRHNSDGDSMTRAQVRARRLYNIGLDDQNNDLRVAQIPSEFDVPPSQCTVTIEYGDEETDDGGLRDDPRAPNRIGSLPFESDSSDEEGALDDFSLSGIGDPHMHRHRMPQNRTSELAQAREQAQIATQEAVRAVGGELLAPDARFYIERDKSNCKITFDPPVSGRFILLKMWSRHRDANANIDIQAVTATGFAGPRFFPAVELR